MKTAETEEENGMEDFFMMKQLAVVETLQSTMVRLRGQYTILALKEKRSQNPDQNKIAALRKRGIEISIKMRKIFSELSLEEKEQANKAYIKELRDLDGLHDPK